MTMTAADRDKTIEQNRQAYGEIYDRLKWPSPEGARRRHGSLIKRDYEELTETGMIHSLAAAGGGSAVDGLVEAFRRHGADDTLWQRSTTGNRLYFHPCLWPTIDFSGLCLVVSYHNTSLKPSPTYQNAFKEIELSPHKSVFIERWPVYSEVELMGNHIPPNLLEYF
jgi:hypothetical protein